MAYRSLFTPISQEDLQEFTSSHDIVINEDAAIAPQAVTPAPAAPVQQAMPAQTPTTMPAQPQVAAQPAQQVAQIDPQSLSQLGKNIAMLCPMAAKDQSLLAVWKTLQAQPTAQNLMTYMSAFAKFAGSQQQPAQAQPQQAAQPVQNISNSLRPKSAWTLIKEKVKYNRALREAEEANKAEIDGSEDIKPKPQQEKKEEAPAKPAAKSDDFNDDKNVDYSSEYSETVSGKKGETTVENKDKVMYDSIFGSKEDPFADSKEVSYHNAYDETGDGPTERDQNTTLTKPEPFKPENPKLTTLSDATAVSKTVFTIDDKGKIADAGASQESSSKKSTSEDDGSDEDVNEGYSSKFPKHLMESFIDDGLKKTIIKQFINIYGEDFSIEDFSDWLEDEYPGIASDPAAFDEISQAVQGKDITMAEDEEIEDDDIDREPEGEDDDFKSGDDYEEIAREYIDSTDLDEYDEDDAIAWCEENYPEIADDDSCLDDLLDAICDMFVEDDINESINDEFYSSEKELKD